ncbi:class I SAM-dependent methyltransferase [Chitinophaga sp.]|uniref:class I SAM-dependent methyltransferase n=1 Tax=Chitinophaga sp. TaxID=1869181 RepID=UPI002F95F103
MAQKAASNLFSGEIPENYDEFLYSLFFEPYAIDLTERIIALNPKNILEVACGTGIVTQHLLKAIPPSATITATDINPGMLALAKQKVANDDRVKLQVVDAHALPFEDNSFDCIFAQFGVMFYGDKPAAYAEAMRVLQPGGTFIFNTWDAMSENPIALIAMELLTEYFPDNPPSFFNIPFSYFNPDVIKADLMQGGYKNISITSLSATGKGANSLDIARGLLKGTPMYNEIAERNYDLLPVLIEALSARLTTVYGSENLKVPLKAFVVTAEK